MPGVNKLDDLRDGDLLRTHQLVRLRVDLSQQDEIHAATGIESKLGDEEHV
jgi:hypothetical protein